MAMVGVAARKQAEMGLWVQRSGWERAVVGVAAWEGLPCKAKVRSLDWGFGPLCLSCRMVFPAGWFFLQDGFSCILAAVQGVCCYLFRKFVEKVPEGGLVYDLTVHESAVCYDERCWDGRDVIQAYVW